MLVIASFGLASTDFKPRECKRNLATSKRSSLSLPWFFCYLMDLYCILFTQMVIKTIVFFEGKSMIIPRTAKEVEQLMGDFITELHRQCDNLQKNPGNAFQAGMFRSMIGASNPEAKPSFAQTSQANANDPVAAGQSFFKPAPYTYL